MFRTSLVFVVIVAPLYRQPSIKSGVLMKLQKSNVFLVASIVRWVGWGCDVEATRLLRVRRSSSTAFVRLITSGYCLHLFLSSFRWSFYRFLAPISIRFPVVTLRSLCFPFLSKE